MKRIITILTTFFTMLMIAGTCFGVEPRTSQIVNDSTVPGAKLNNVINNYVKVVYPVILAGGTIANPTNAIYELPLGRETVGTGTVTSVKYITRNGTVNFDVFKKYWTNDWDDVTTVNANIAATTNYAEDTSWTISTFVAGDVFGIKINTATDCTNIWISVSGTEAK